MACGPAALRRPGFCVSFRRISSGTPTSGSWNHFSGRVFAVAFSHRPVPRSPPLSDRPVMHYIDNQGSLYSVINGRSSDDDTNRLVFVSRLYYARARCDVWYDYVPSASNIADLPTRLDAAAFTRLERVARRVPLVLIPEWCMSCPYARLSSLF